MAASASSALHDPAGQANAVAAAMDQANQDTATDLLNSVRCDQ